MDFIEWILLFLCHCEWLQRDLYLHGLFTQLNWEDILAGIGGIVHIFYSPNSLLFHFLFALCVGILLL